MKRQIRILILFLTPYFLLELFICFPRLIEKEGDLKFIEIHTPFIIQKPAFFSFLLNKYWIPIESWKIDNSEGSIHPYYIFRENETYIVYMLESPDVDYVPTTTKYHINSNKVLSRHKSSIDEMNRDAYDFYFKKMIGLWVSSFDTLLIDSNKVVLNSITYPLQLFEFRGKYDDFYKRHFGKNADHILGKHQIGLDLNNPNETYDLKNFKGIIRVEDNKLVLADQDKNGYFLDSIIYKRIK